jgi:hypothetical protein
VDELDRSFRRADIHVRIVIFRNNQCHKFSFQKKDSLILRMRPAKCNNKDKAGH